MGARIGATTRREAQFIGPTFGQTCHDAGVRPHGDPRQSGPLIHEHLNFSGRYPFNAPVPDRPTTGTRNRDAGLMPLA
jgi:hypothetical protein